MHEEWYSTQDAETILNHLKKDVLEILFVDSVSGFNHISNVIVSIEIRGQHFFQPFIFSFNNHADIVISLAGFKNINQYVESNLLNNIIYYATCEPPFNPHDLDDVKNLIIKDFNFKNINGIIENLEKNLMIKNIIE